MAADGHKSRRAALCALAGASVLVVPTIGAIASSFPDPIFAAIERHRSAYQSLNATRSAMQDLISEREVSKAEWDAYDRAHESEDAAFDKLVTDKPKESLQRCCDRRTLLRLVESHACWGFDTCTLHRQRDQRSSSSSRILQQVVDASTL